jgi:pimeloyl-ACP methyl ester carboxylesterase
LAACALPAGCCSGSAASCSRSASGRCCRGDAAARWAGPDRGARARRPRGRDCAAPALARAALARPRRLRRDDADPAAPVFFFTGRRDWNTPGALVEEWAANLEAPHVEIVWFEGVGHLPPIEAPEAFQRAWIEKLAR